MNNPRTTSLATLVFATLCGAPAALGGIYTLRVASMDIDQGVEGCNAYIQQVAAQFQQDAGVSVISAACEVDSPMDSIKGEIAYSAPKSANVWSTTSTTYGEQLDFYYTRQQCEEALGREVALVKDLTGLTPFLAFCHKTSSIGAPRYRTRIDAVGFSDVFRYESAAFLSHSLVDPNPPVAVLHEQARELGIGPFAWYHGPVRSMRSLAVTHYQKGDRTNRFYLHGKSSVYLPTLEECEAARAAFDRTRTADWLGVTACSAAHPSVGFQMNLLWWDRAIGADLAIKTTSIPGAYSSLDDCRSASDAISRQISSSGEQVIGIACGRDHNPRGPIKMEVLSKWTYGQSSRPANAGSN
ncbi:MAG: hypothetical protein RIQ81_1079 [Pseudomonadota bacterium]|jgi:hypothetical protein